MDGRNIGPVLRIGRMAVHGGNETFFAMTTISFFRAFGLVPGSFNCAKSVFAQVRPSSVAVIVHFARYHDSFETPALDPELSRHKGGTNVSLLFFILQVSHAAPATYQ